MLVVKAVVNLGIIVVVHNSDPVVDCVAVSVVCLEKVDKTDVVVSAEVAKNYKIPLLCTLNNLNVHIIVRSVFI